MKAILIPLLAVALSGCSGEPSEADLKNALIKEVDKANVLLDKSSGVLGAQSLKTEVKEVKKIGCKESSDSAGYNCDIKITATSPMLGTTTNNGTARFVKGDDGWEVITN